MSIVVNEAREWVGTPYKHQHSTKHQGCDCLGLVRGIWRKVIGPEPLTAPNYSPSWDEGGKNEILLNTFDSLFTRVDVIEPGSVLIFRMKRNRVAKHCGIAVDENTMIHAYQPDCVIEMPISQAWRRRIVAIGNFPLGE